MPCGGGIYGGQTHSQSPEALFTQVCGLRTVMPSNPYDAKGLLIAAIENDDPVIFLEPKRLYNGPFDGHHDRPVVPWSQHPLGEVPEGYYTVPLDTASVFRPGSQLTVLTYGTMVFVARRRARDRHRRRDHRPAQPLAAGPGHHRRFGEEDRPLRRGARGHAHQRLWRRAAALVQEHCFYHLEAPIERVTGWDTPYPHAQEWAVFPRPRPRRRGLSARHGGMMGTYM
jgi:2-oxoisovalerate dehydrogenase E1 component beta subunit